MKIRAHTAQPTPSCQCPEPPTHAAHAAPGPSTAPLHFLHPPPSNSSTNQTPHPHEASPHTGTQPHGSTQPHRKTFRLLLPMRAFTKQNVPPSPPPAHGGKRSPSAPLNPNRRGPQTRGSGGVDPHPSGTAGLRLPGLSALPPAAAPCPLCDSRTAPQHLRSRSQTAAIGPRVARQRSGELRFLSVKGGGKGKKKKKNSLFVPEQRENNGGKSCGAPSELETKPSLRFKGTVKAHVTPN